MSRFRLLVASLVATFAFGAVVAGGALAVEGPIWIHEGGVEVEEQTETKNAIKLEAENVGSFVLKSSLATIECTELSGPSYLMGANPGKDLSTIDFKGCTVGGKSECWAGQEHTGQIPEFEVRTLLGYPEGSAGSEEEAYDQFYPVNSETVFVEFRIVGPACGLLKGQKVKVVATGTTVGGAKCGIIGIAGKFTELNEFVRVLAGEEAVQGGLEFPNPAITKEEIWNGTAFEKVTCSLEAKSLLSSKAEQIGTVKLTGAEAFGWDV
jgi:hypothetical protein